MLCYVMLCCVVLCCVINVMFDSLKQICILVSIFVVISKTIILKR